MNQFLKKTLGATALGLMGLAVTACGAADAPTPATQPPATGGATATTEAPEPATTVEGSIGIVLPSTDLPRWLQDEVRFNDLLAGTGINSHILFSQDSASVEANHVETLITLGVDVIILAPVDGVAASAAANNAYNAGIPLIAYDRLIMDTVNVPYYITFDSIAVGQAQGQFLVDNATGTGNPLYLYSGWSIDNNAFLFFEGAWTALQPYIVDGTFVIQNSSEAVALQNNLTLTRAEMASIMGQIDTQWSNATARNMAEAHLTVAGPEGKGEVFILAPNDGTALGISDAFADDPEVSRIWITGQDAEVSSVQGIIDGRQTMTVFKDVRTLAADAIDTALAIIEGRPVNTTFYFDNNATQVPSILTEVVVVDINNLRSELIDSGFLTEDLFDWTNYPN